MCLVKVKLVSGLGSKDVKVGVHGFGHRVATSSGLLKMIGLFCKRVL